MLRPRTRWTFAAVAVVAVALAALLGAGRLHRGRPADPAQVAARAATPSPVPPTPTPAPSPAAATPAATPLAAPDRQVPVYTAVFDLDIPAVGVHEPVISVGLKSGSMDAPFGPLSSPVWHEAFWLNLTAEPGQPGTLTLAGHLDDTAGRPAAFWTVRQLHPGDVVTLRRRGDGSSVRYRITDVHSYSDAQANSAPVLARFYGSVGGGVDDGVARISLITCTGHFVHGEYDQRFMAFGELLPPGA